MLFSEIRPYIRYARLLKVDENTYFRDSVPLDARLFYTLEGFGKIYVKNKEYEMPPFALIIINSGTPYKIIKSEASVSYLAINFDYTQNAAKHNTPVPPVKADSFREEMLLDYCTFEDSEELSEVLYIKQIPSLRKKLNAILSEHMQKLLYYENTTGHIMAQCIAESMRFLQLGNACVEKETVNRILSYIHENFQKNLTNETIGSVFGYHPNYISFLVKHLTGMPIHKYIIHLRLMNAVSLLENTSLSCEKIALACGFCDCAYFSRYFKRHFGINPSKYRRC